MFMKNKQFIEHQYCQLNKTQKEIAKEIGVSQVTVANWMKTWGIKPRQSGRSRPQILGKKFGQLTVEAKEAGSDPKHPRWTCKCDCGNICSATSSDLTKSLKISCPPCGRLRTGVKLWKGAGEISGHFWNQVRQSAKVRNLSLDVTKEDAWDLFLKQKGICALSGVTIEIKRCNDNTASLDRIDSSKGYTLDNIQWVHKRINWMKGDTTEKEFIEWCKTIVDYKKRK